MTTEHLKLGPDWNPRAVLLSMRPRGWSRVYVVGCFDRRITFFNQQARSLTLIRALFDTQELTSGRQVGIIGAGAAGITAAVAAASRGCEVSLFDEHDAVLTLQSPASHRFLHPHIYTWPASGSDDRDAGLPYLNWTADSADRVVEQLRKEFAQHRLRFGHQLRFFPKSNITRLLPEPNGRVKLLGNEALINSSFDVVLLTVGFGLEHPPFPNAPTPSYWRADPLNGPFHKKQSILISGAGDGGLIDVARAAIRSSEQGSYFRHDEAVTFLTEHPAFRQIACAMQDADNDTTCEPGIHRSLYHRYAALDVDASLVERLRRLKRSNTDVTFNYCTESVFTTDSALLNRLLVFLLMHSGIVTPIFGKVVSVQQSPLDSSRQRVQFDAHLGRGSEAEYDIVMLRFGPPRENLAMRFPDLGSAGIELGGTVADLAITQSLRTDTVAWYQSPERVAYAVTIEGAVNHKDLLQIQDVVAQLRRLSCDMTMTLESIELGSGQLILQGAPSGYAVMQELHISGQLSGGGCINVKDVALVDPDATSSTFLPADVPVLPVTPIVVFVDDDRFYASLWIKALQKHFNVVHFVDAGEALNAINVMPTIHCVVCDVMMPTPPNATADETSGGQATGVWLLKQAAGRVIDQSIPVIMLTHREANTVRELVVSLELPDNLVIVRNKLETDRNQLLRLVHEKIVAHFHDLR